MRLGNTTFTQETGKYTHTPGRQLTWKVLAGRASTGDLETILDALVPWMEYLLQHARRATLDDIGASSRPTLLASYVVAGDMLDCTTFNLIDTRSGLVPIDMECKASSDLPLGWIVTRGVAQALSVGGVARQPSAVGRPGRRGAMQSSGSCRLGFRGAPVDRAGNKLPDGGSGSPRRSFVRREGLQRPALFRQ